MIAGEPDALQARAFRGARVRLSLLVVAWGVQAIVTQALLLREATVLMYGSELAWGVVFGAWLLGIAAGAALGGWLGDTAIGRGHAVGTLVADMLALSALACVALWVFRGARDWLGVGPGELVPLPHSALAALLLVTPASALVGLAFPIACCIGERARLGGREIGVGEQPHGAAIRPHLSFAHVYALESLGSLIGGAAFTFWAVTHLAPIQAALLCAGLTAAAGALLMSPRRVTSTLLASAAVAALLGAWFAGERLNRLLIERRWQTIAPGYTLVAEAESKYQNLAIGSRAGQFTLYCDGHVAADFPDPYTFIPRAHFWLCQHPAPRRVLVLGGGAEGLLAEILRHPVEHIDYVEPDPQLIDLIRPYLAEADRRALDDPRVSVHHVDARYYIKTQRDRFDLAIARLPEPTSAQRARLYTAEFFGELRRALTPQAVLCLTASAAPAELSPPSRTYLSTLRATLRRHFPRVLIGWGDPAQVLAATQDGLISTDAAELSARYTRRAVDSALFDPAWFAGATDWLEPDKLAGRAADLDAAEPARVCRDLHPLIYMQRLVLWEAQSGGWTSSRLRETAPPAARDAGLVARLQTVRLHHLVLGLALAAGATMVLSRLRHGARRGWARGTVTLSVATTGFATMALSLVWLFAFQNLYGYVYQRIAWIIALFMAGLVVGCLLAGRKQRHTPSASVHRARRHLIAIDVLLAILAAAVPLVLIVLGSLSGSSLSFALVEWCISLMVIITGVLGGAAFPLASELQLHLKGTTAAAAGNVVSADHAGACLGAVLCGILLVPVFGTITTAGLLAGVKLASAAALAIAQPGLEAE